VARFSAAGEHYARRTRLRLPATAARSREIDRVALAHACTARNPLPRGETDGKGDDDDGDGVRAGSGGRRARQRRRRRLAKVMAISSLRLPVSPPPRASCFLRECAPSLSTTSFFRSRPLEDRVTIARADSAVLETILALLRDFCEDTHPSGFRQAWSIVKRYRFVILYDSRPQLDGNY